MTNSYKSQVSEIKTQQPGQSLRENKENNWTAKKTSVVSPCKGQNYKANKKQKKAMKMSGRNSRKWQAGYL